MAKTIDADELRWQAHELDMYIDSDEPLYNRKMALFLNYHKKFKKGIFNRDLAVKGFSNLTDAAAQKYNKEFKYSGMGTIGTQARRVVDKKLVEEFLDAERNKEYGFMV